MAFIFKQIMLIVTSAILVISPSLKFNAGVSQNPPTYDNVILMIGDGMGENSIRAAKHLYGMDDVTLNMETCPVKSWSITDNILGERTDSAAGGTALATGVHTDNKQVATYYWDKYGAFIVPQTLCEYAKEIGKSAGAITTDKTTGATPADFTSHADSRKHNQEVVRCHLYSDIDLIWGADDMFAHRALMEKHGYTYISNATEMNALTPGSRSYGEFYEPALQYVTGENDTPTLDQMTAKAIELLDADEDGFFLMVEGACIDKHSHKNMMEDMARSLMEFDAAIGVALDFAKADGNTLVVITADHETGGITYSEAKDTYYYTTGNHTRVNVPVFVSDAEAGFVDGETYLNRQIGVQLAYTMGASPSDFPKPIYGYYKPLGFFSTFRYIPYYAQALAKDLYGLYLEYRNQAA